MVFPLIFEVIFPIVCSAQVLGLAGSGKGKDKKTSTASDVSTASAVAVVKDASKHSAFITANINLFGAHFLP